jgi:ATP-dependent RNA helicase DOB1
MSANDLFSFLEPSADDDNDDAMVQDVPEANENTSVPDRPTTPSNLKRKADINSPNGDMNVEADSKRLRVRSPNPVVLDDFETEARREVAASAGLTGAATEAGSRLELRHQVPSFAMRILLFSSLVYSS